MNRFRLALFALALLACPLASGNVHNPFSKPVLIVTKGSSGDANGAMVLQNSWQATRPDLLNLSRHRAQGMDMSQYRCVVVVGQAAMHDIAGSTAMTAMLSGRTVGLYEHVIDESGLKLMRALHGHGTLNLFFTDSQLSLLRLKNPSGHAFVQQEAGRIWPAPLVVQTVSTQPAAANDRPNTRLTAADHVVWLGGNYTDSSGQPRVLSTAEIVTALGHLHASITPGSTVAIMLKPRLFDAAMDDTEKITRLIAMRTVFESSHVVYYGSDSLIAELASTGIPIRAAPSYATLMHLSWSKHTKHYASADQFNLFADFNRRLQPFLLDPTDADQALYALDYMHGGGTGLTEAIRRHGCDG